MDPKSPHRYPSLFFCGILLLANCASCDKLESKPAATPPKAGPVEIEPSGKEAKADVAVPQSVREVAEAAIGPAPGPPSVFTSKDYTFPSNFSTLLAEDNVDLFKVELDVSANAQSVGFSNDGKCISWQTLEEPSKGFLIIHGLKDLKTVHEIDLQPGVGKSILVENAAWSPDDKKILLVCRIYPEARLDLKVLDIKTKSLVSLPVGFPGAKGRPPQPDAAYLAWVEPNHVVVRDLLGDYCEVLNLDTLKYERVTAKQLEMAYEKGTGISILEMNNRNVVNEHIALGSDSTGRFFAIKSRTSPYSRTLDIEISAYPRRHVIAPKRAQIAVTGPGGNGLSLYHWYIPLQSRQVFFRAKLPLQKDAEKALIGALKPKQTLHGKLYATRVNPLNQKVLGPDTSKPKGGVYLYPNPKAGPGIWLVRMIDEPEPIHFFSGCLVTDIAPDGDASRILRNEDGDAMWSILESVDNPDEDIIDNVLGVKKLAPK